MASSADLETLLPDALPLRAGPLSMLFEPETGFLRYVHLGEHEVLRGLYAAVRDHNWDTIPAKLSNLRLDQADHRFDLNFDVVVRRDPVHFVWRGRITGDADGTVRFEMDGEARSTFRRNRIGFCILHSMSCAGTPCTIQHADGAVEKGTFPDAISPHQPFMDIRCIVHEVMPGVRVEVKGEGDVFEMEDQRNWTDASYKTYCTPLARPFPVEVPVGTRIRQAVTISVQGGVPEDEAENESADAVYLTVSRKAIGSIPKIGLGMARPMPSEQEVERLAALNLDHLRVDLRLSEDGFRDRLEQATRTAQALGIKLEVAVFVDHDAEAQLSALREVVDALQPPLAHWLIFHVDEKSTSARWITLARRFLGDEAPIGGGTDAYFTELNRERPPVDVLDLVCYSVNPQVHAFDNASMVETLETQGVAVESAGRFAGGLPIAVTPVTLQARFNPNATGPEADIPPDPRQHTPFAAAWTLGSLKHLSENGAASLTYFETHGPNGVMGETLYPIYHVLSDIGEFSDAEIHSVVSSSPLQVKGLALTEGDWSCILLANMTPSPQRVCLRISAHVQHATLKTGDRLTLKAGALNLDLSPYAYVRLDLGRNDIQAKSASRA